MKQDRIVPLHLTDIKESDEHQPTLCSSVDNSFIRCILEKLYVFVLSEKKKYNLKKKMFGDLAQQLNATDIECKFSSDNYPDEIVYKSNTYLPSTRKKIKTMRGFVKFYSYLELKLIFKLIKPAYKHFAILEAKGNLLLMDYPTDYILPVIHASQYGENFTFVSIVMGQDLRETSNLERRKNIKPKFENIMQLFTCMVKGLYYLDSLHLVYSDLKLENIVKDEESYRIIDFDSLKVANESGIVNTYFGTPGMKSLQRLHQDISSISHDIWSLSIVIYEYITKATSPWNKIGDFTQKLQKRAVKNIRFATKHWIKSQRRKIIRLFLRMNEYDDKKRITIGELMQEI
jgi:serine/threonine protein kinase